MSPTTTEYQIPIDNPSERVFRADSGVRLSWARKHGMEVSAPPGCYWRIWSDGSHLFLVEIEVDTEGHIEVSTEESLDLRAPSCYGMLKVMVGEDIARQLDHHFRAPVPA